MNKEKKVTLVSPEALQVKKRLVELRMEGNNWKDCFAVLKTEGFKITYECMRQMWGTIDVNAIIDELILRQLSDLNDIGKKILDEKTLDDQVVTIDHKLKAWKIMLDARDKLIKKFVRPRSGGSNTQVNVIVDAPEPIPQIVSNPDDS
jgi:hypothetical protein